MQTVKRRCAQTAHISLHHPSMSKSDPKNKKYRSASFLAHSVRLAFRFSRAFSRLCHRPFRHRRCFASVRRYLRNGAGSRKREKRECLHFFDRADFTRKIWGLGSLGPQGMLRCGRYFPQGSIGFAALRQLSTDSPRSGDRTQVVFRPRPPGGAGLSTP